MLFPSAGLPRSKAKTMNACNAMYVMVFDKDEVSIADRCSPIKPYESQQACGSLIPNEAVKFPPKPTSGIVNITARETLLRSYAKNPAVFSVNASGKEQQEGGGGSSRHFLGFGFSKDAPYFPPGTILRFRDGEEAVITGMVAAHGQRSHEYAVILSLDRPVNPDAASAFLDSYNLTEIDGGDEGLCACLANIIRKYSYTIGDVDPSCTSTDAMEGMVAEKFQAEMERMFACIQSVVTMPMPRGEGWTEAEWEHRNECIASAFRAYRQTLLMQMRHQPLGTREWLQMFESYMTFAATERGLGFIDFVLSSPSDF